MAKKQKKTDDLNETGKRIGDRRKESMPVASDNRKVQRRRLIDPTTCERDYSEGEIEFMQAMDEYKRTSGRMFPTCSEILEVLNEMGYRRLSPAELADEIATSADCDTTQGEEELEEELESISDF